MEKQFQELTDKIIAEGFVAIWRTSPSGHPYILAGTHQSTDRDINCIHNAIMITHDPDWVVATTWPGQVGHEYMEKDFESTFIQAITQLNSKK